jgi:hypothetical protein
MALLAHRHRAVAVVAAVVDEHEGERPHADQQSRG